MTQDGMNIDEASQVAAFIEKLPLSQKAFCNSLEHVKADLSPGEVISHIQIEKNNRMKDQTSMALSQELATKTNLVDT